MTWQPIETAPKIDWQEVLLYGRSGWCVVGQWLGGWVETTECSSVDATHWMPLPDPPKPCRHSWRRAQRDGETIPNTFLCIDCYKVQVRKPASQMIEEHAKPPEKEMFLGEILGGIKIYSCQELDGPKDAYCEVRDAKGNVLATFDP